MLCGAAAEVNESLIELIKEAFTIRNQLLLSGSDDSIETMTERLRTGKGHLTSLVRLSYLAPDIVRALLAGRQPNWAKVIHSTRRGTAPACQKIPRSRKSVPAENRRHQGRGHAGGISSISAAPSTNITRRAKSRFDFVASR
jgi:hypothetical protein